MNILVIDDDFTVCQICQTILQKQGCQVKIALSGCEGLEQARQADFDLIIVDLRMPDMDGMAVVETIKHEQPQTAVIIMTSHSTVHSAVKGMKLGAADYLSKPFKPEELSAAVKKALQARKTTIQGKESGVLINKETISAVLTRASQDKEFAARLSHHGSDILEEYDLTPEEKTALVSVMQPPDEEALDVISHELKTPLSSIALLARTLQHPEVAGDQKEEFLNKIIARAEGALQRIEEYLILSRIIANKSHIEPERVNFCQEIIRKALDDQQEAMLTRELSARLEVPEELEVVCDPRYIRVVYNNLINNATKYGVVATEIYLGYGGLRNNLHYFNVANVGEWIKPGYRKRIFEKYAALGKQGVGIGLHATREIIRKHGGDIWVEPCYFVEGTCIAEKAIIKKADDTFLTGNNFIFTLGVMNDK